MKQMKGVGPAVYAVVVIAIFAFAALYMTGNFQLQIQPGAPGQQQPGDSLCESSTSPNLSCDVSHERGELLH